MQVPAPMQHIARTLALRSWVQRKDFPLEHYCGTVDGAYELLRRHDPPNDDDDPPPDQVVPMIAAVLDHEGELLEYCLEKATYEVSDDDAWTKVLNAAAWTVLQRYDKAVKNGEWPRS